MPGNGTYEERNLIFAAVMGNVEEDTANKVLSVVPLPSVPPKLKEGDIVIGRIMDIKPQFAIVEIAKTKGVKRSLPGEMRGAIHISQVRQSYVDDLTKEFAVGDIVYAKIMNTKRDLIALSVAEKELGVVKAFCTTCAMPLSLTDKGLRCLNCKKNEMRKYSINYGKAEV
jgi:exosome complex component CSL4